METVRDMDRMRGLVERARAAGRVVGLVPTMGFFHEGHLELMRRARAECDVVVVSLFVNPTQFGPAEDYDAYPRDFERDGALAEEVGVDYLFSPGAEQMYPEGFQTSVSVEEISKVMCGAIRPGHFDGVAAVVAKLFNIIPAHKAYFGQKDAQQLVIIKRMAEDLNFPLEMVAVPTVREEDGLAMSSRNSYLSQEERRAATVLYRSLETAASLIESGARNAEVIRGDMEKVISTEALVNLEYIVICDNIYLQPLPELSGEVLVALAARVGVARLIDSMVFDVE
ncbi:MAG: pantoate--beta-alanine ligase [Actinobacteria bacterium]|nr:pantoate--beta-alanine ligase [Actinomycetota bacterium]